MASDNEPRDGDHAAAQADWAELIPLARSFQYDRYLAATLAPRLAQPDLIALAAFAGDVSRIPQLTTEPAIGAIRLQWWRDALLAKTGERTGNPLADTIRDVVQRRNLPNGLLIGLVDAQEVELYSDLVEDIETLRTHFQKRDGALFTLCARVLGADLDHAARELIAVAATAYGLAVSASEFHARCQRGQLLVPADLALRHGVDPSMPQVAGGGAALISELSDLAERDYRVASTKAQHVSRALRTALLPVSLTGCYLTAARRQFDAAKSVDIGPTPLMRGARMLWCHWRGRM